MTELEQIRKEIHELYKMEVRPFKRLQELSDRITEIQAEERRK